LLQQHQPVAGEEVKGQLKAVVSIQKMQEGIRSRVPGYYR
jgi:hypothetical protein